MREAIAYCTLFLIVLLSDCLAKDKYVANFAGGGSVMVYNHDDVDNISPKRMLSGANPVFGNHDETIIYENELYSNETYYSESIRIFNLTDDGNVSPERIISGANTLIDNGYRMFIECGEIYVGNYGAGQILVFDSDDVGNVTPKRMITIYSYPYDLSVYGEELFMVRPVSAGTNAIYVFNKTDNRTDLTIVELPVPNISDGSSDVCERRLETYPSDFEPDTDYKWIVTGGTINGNDNKFDFEVIWGDEEGPATLKNFSDQSDKCLPGFNNHCGKCKCNT